MKSLYIYIKYNKTDNQNDKAKYEDRMKNIL
jgi:hypothetical protein